MTTQTMPGIRHSKLRAKNNSSTPSGAQYNALEKALPPTLIYQGENEELWGVEGDINDPFVYTLVALPILEKRIKFGNLMSNGRPVENLRDFVRAWELLESST